MNNNRKEFIVNNHKDKLEMLKTVKDGDLITYKDNNNNITIVWLDLFDKPSDSILKQYETEQI